MSETFEDRTDRRLDSVERRLTAIETELHTVAEQTAGIPVAINRLLELMGDFRHHAHVTSGPIIDEDDTP